jgi:Cys-tRNA(Pro)/Cys-tRNA(Cys) deacylase
MRELERGGVPYVPHTYDVSDQAAPHDVPGHDLGVRIAASLGQDPDQALKTLVCVSPTGDHVVCCIPVDRELDLKKAASAAGEKSLSMMHVADLEATCGYVRGACSPVGMRRQFPTLIDETAELFDTVFISGGRLGLQLECDPERLAGFVGAVFADICREGEAS